MDDSGTDPVYGLWKLEPNVDRNGVSMWLDNGVLMLRAVEPGYRDPVELGTSEGVRICVAMLERVRRIEIDDEEEAGAEHWREIARLAKEALEGP